MPRMRRSERRQAITAFRSPNWASSTRTRASGASTRMEPATRQRWKSILQTPGGPYYGEYTVRKNDTGAAVIVGHSLVKP